MAEQERDGEMAPPRLRLVTNEGVENAPEAQEAIELARALAEADGMVQEDDTSPSSSPSSEPASASFVPGAVALKDLRIVEALLFASPVSLDQAWLAGHLRHGSDITAVLAEIKAAYAPRGVNLVRVSGKWVFRTSEDLGYLLQRYAVEERRLSRAALETLAIVAYHQPVTRAEIESVRGVQASRGTLDVLLELKLVRMRGRRRTPGRPVTYGTTDAFLEHFGLASLADLPGAAEMRAAGLLSLDLPADFNVPTPGLAAPEEDPIEDEAEAPEFHVDFLGEAPEGASGGAESA